MDEHGQSSGSMEEMWFSWISNGNFNNLLSLISKNLPLNYESIFPVQIIQPASFHNAWDTI